MLKLIKCDGAETAIKSESEMEEKYDILGIARNYNDIFGEYPITAKIVVNNLKSAERDGKMHFHFLESGSDDECKCNLTLGKLDVTVNKFVSYMAEHSVKKIRTAFNDSINIDGFMPSLKQLVGFVILEEKYKRGTLQSENVRRSMAERFLFKEIKNEIFHATMKANKLYNETLDADKSFEVMSECIKSGIQDVFRAVSMGSDFDNRHLHRIEGAVGDKEVVL